MKRQSILRLCALTALFSMQAHKLFAGDVYSLSVVKQPRMTVKVGASGHKSTFIINNYGTIVENNCHYKVTMDKKVVEEKTVNFAQPLKPNASGSLTINIPKQSKAGDYELTLEITQINGKPNASPGRFGKLAITAVNRLPTCRVVFEDYTANWCSWCPIGIAIMRQMAKKHPNDFIGIVAHQGDKMGIKGYDIPGNPHSGVPILWASRTDKIEGATGELYYQMAKQRGAMMDIDVQAQWDVTGKRINVQSTTTFRSSRNNARFALAYVLLEDRIQRADWPQANGYSGSKSYLGKNPELDYFVKSPNPIKNFVFEDVARAYLGIAQGLDGSLPQNVVADSPIAHKTVFNGIDDWINVLNKSNLRVVVLVIDREANCIINAARCAIKAKPTTGITPVTASQERVEVARYNLKGQRITMPQPGVNIVKYSDGSVEKVYVR